VDECGQMHYAKRLCYPHYKKAGRESADQARLDALNASAGRIQEEIGAIQQLLRHHECTTGSHLGLVLTIVWLIVARWFTNRGKKS
jgi:hypothetical protein